MGTSLNELKTGREKLELINQVLARIDSISMALDNTRLDEIVGLKEDCKNIRNECENLKNECLNFKNNISDKQEDILEKYNDICNKCLKIIEKNNDIQLKFDYIKKAYEDFSLNKEEIKSNIAILLKDEFSLFATERSKSLYQDKENFLEELKIKKNEYIAELNNQANKYSGAKIEYIFSLIEDNEDYKEIENLEQYINQKQQEYGELSIQLRQALSEGPSQYTDDLINQMNLLSAEISEQQVLLNDKRDKFEIAKKEKKLVTQKMLDTEVANLNQFISASLENISNDFEFKIATISSNITNNANTFTGANTFTEANVFTGDNSFFGNNTFTDASFTRSVGFNGNTTFMTPPLSYAAPTEAGHLATKDYVDNVDNVKNGIKSLGAVGSIELDLTQEKNIRLTANKGCKLGASCNNAGKSGIIIVDNAQNLAGFNAPFNFRTTQAGFSGTEIFIYFCVSIVEIRLIRT